MQSMKDHRNRSRCRAGGRRAATRKQNFPPINFEETELHWKYRTLARLQVRCFSTFLFRGPLHHVRASECRQRHRLFPRIHFCLIDPSLSTEPTATTAISEKEPSSNACPVAQSVGRSSDKVPRIVRRVTCPCLLLSPPDRRQEVLVVGLSDLTRTHDSAAGLQLAKEGAVAQYISP